MMDFGWAQNLTLETVKPFITQKGSIKPEKVARLKILAYLPGSKC